MPQAIHISPIDNVVVALHPIAKGTLVEVDGLSVTALEDIPQGHKMAVKSIRNGENVIKYGFPIGHATADAEPGTWMHTHNVHTNLSGEVEYSYNPAPDLDEDNPLAPYHVTEHVELKVFPQGAENVTMEGRLIGGCMDCLVDRKSVV